MYMNSTAYFCEGGGEKGGENKTGKAREEEECQLEGGDLKGAKSRTACHSVLFLAVFFVYGQQVGEEG